MNKILVFNYSYHYVHGLLISLQDKKRQKRVSQKEYREKKRRAVKKKAKKEIKKKAQADAFTILKILKKERK